MNSVPFDSNIKVNMSLDEIIRLNRRQCDCHLRSRYSRTLKKWKRSSKRTVDMDTPQHSLMSSVGGVDMYVSKKKPHLCAENKRPMVLEVSDRMLSSNLLERSQVEIIPTKCKLVKTNREVERALFRTNDNSLKPLRRKLSPPIKLYKNNDNSNADVFKSLKDKLPPLIVAPIYASHEQLVQSIPMEVDNSDDEINILNNQNCKKMLEVIDIETSILEDILEIKKLYVGALNSVSQTAVKTLNDRFTLVSKNFRTD